MNRTLYFSCAFLPVKMSRFRSFKNTLIKTSRLELRRLAFATTALAVMASATNANAEITIPADAAINLPVTLTGSYLSGRLAGKNKDIATAAAFFREALEADPNNPFLLDRAFILTLANGDFDQSLAYAQQLIDNEPDHFLARLALSANAMKKDNFETAVDLMKIGGRGPLAKLTAGLIAAWAEQAQGAEAEALERIAALEGPDWYTVFQTYHSGLIQELDGEQEGARDNFASAYGADQGALRVIDAHARAMAKSGDKVGALTILDRYDQLLPDHPVLLATRKAIEADAPLPNIVNDAREGAAEVLYGLGAAIGRDGGEELAAVYLQMALELDPKASVASIALANLFERLGKPERAIEVLKKIAPSSPLKRDAEIQIGLDYNALENLEQSRKHLEAIIDNDPSDLEAIIALGNVLRSHNLFEEADEVYTRGVDTIETPEQKHWTLYYFRGISKERSKKWPEAEKDLRQALELAPDQPLVLNYLGYSMVDQGQNLDEALNMIQKAVALNPKDGYIVDSLGWVYYKLGRYREAARELEKAVELKPDDPVINDHLGDAYWRIGRRIEARFKWNHARDLNPEPELLEKILDKIANDLSEEAPVTEAAKASTEENGG